MNILERFNLPLTVNGSSLTENTGNVCGSFNLPNEAEAARVALNNYDKLVGRLEVEQEQFKQIRLHTQDGDLACVCADHEMKIKELLSSLSK